MVSFDRKMPPRTAKKTPPGPGMKRTARARAMQKTQVQPEETNVKAEEMVEEQNTVVVIEEKKATEPGKEAKEKESATKDNGDASGQSKWILLMIGSMANWFLDNLF